MKKLINIVLISLTLIFSTGCAYKKYEKSEPKTLFEAARNGFIEGGIKGAEVGKNSGGEAMAVGSAVLGTVMSTVAMGKFVIDNKNGEVEEPKSSNSEE
ncbi:MAG: hypothetical protein U9Q33_01640 [Campylobacterota bacterium]|nr:hypothetical protein [Campylobacterota bacterium]